MTVELPESVARRAEAKAAELGVSLPQFVADAVEEKLKVVPADKPWMQMYGALSHLHEENLRIERIIEEEFEEIEPEDAA